MSLINDALKRASEAERNRQREPSLAELMQPVRPQRGSGVRTGIMAVCVVVLLAVAGWLLIRYFAPHRPIAAVPEPAPVAAKPAVATPAPAPSAAPAPAPVPVAAPVVKTNPFASSVVSNEVAADKLPPVAPVAVEPPAPFPDVNLKGIFYNRTKPKVVIGDKIYLENEEADGVRIVKIFPSKVSVEWHGQTKDFFLSGR